MKHFIVTTQNNFKAGTVLSGSLQRFTDGLRLVVWRANGIPILKSGFLTEKLSNLKEKQTSR